MPASLRSLAGRDDLRSWGDRLRFAGRWLEMTFGHVERGGGFAALAGG